MAQLLYLPKFVNEILSEDLTTELHLLSVLWLDMAHESKNSDLISCSKVKQKQALLQGWIGFQEVEAHRHMKVVRLSALCTDHLYLT